MTTLAANTSVTITLDGDDVLTTDGNATFQITPTSGGKGEGYLTGHQTLGPYGQYVTIVLTSINNPITYSQASDSSAGELVRLSGDGTSLVSGDGTNLYLHDGPNTFDCFGDSISQYQTAKKTISSLTQTGGVATAACTAHGFNTGTYQTVCEASVDGYNGTFLVTVTSANAFTYLVDSSLAASATGASALQKFKRNDTNWFDWASFRLGGRMILKSNFGQGGKAAWEMATTTRMADVRDSASRNVIVELGRNDITQGRSVAQIVTALTTIITTFLGYGKRVWVLTVPPVESGHAAYSVQNSNREYQVNAWLRRYVQASASNNLVLVDVAALLVDPTSTGGAARSTYLNATDYVHPTPVGARLAYGEALYQAALYRLPAWNTLPSCVLDAAVLNRQTLTSITQSGGTATATKAAHGFLTGEYIQHAGATETGYNGLKQILSVPTSGTYTFAVDSATATPATGTLFAYASDQLSDNPMMLGTGGNTTGTAGVVTQTDPVPDNTTVKCTANAAVTTTVAARTDGIGKNLVLTCTATAAATSVTAQYNAASGLHTRCTMGDTIYAECGLNVSGMTAVKAISFSLQATVDGVTYVSEPWTNLALGATHFTQTDTGDLVVRTPDFEIPVGTSMTVLIWALQISFDANPSAAVAKIGRVAVRRKLPYMSW